MSKTEQANKLELVLERELDVPRNLVWKAWTTREHIEPWWCPKPYSAKVVDMNVKPGGAFNMQMFDPEGYKLPPNNGCYLELVENERLSFTSALLEGFQPAPETDKNSEGCDFPFTAIITFSDLPGGKTKYVARGLHRNEQEMKKHETMGFHEGWGICADQLVAYIKENLM